MNALMQFPALSLFLTIAVFWAGEAVYRRSLHHPLAHPFFVAFMLLIIVLNVLPLPYPVFYKNTSALQQMLAVATVALAVPVYVHKRRIRQYFLPLMLTLVIGSVLTVGIAVGIVYVFGLDRSVMIAMATKSITTPIAVALASDLGGSPALAASFIMVTGLLGAMFGEPLMRLGGKAGKAEKGIAYGLTAHAIGTARALEIDQEMGAFSALAMGINGIFTAVTLPLLVHWLSA